MTVFVTFLLLIALVVIAFLWRQNVRLKEKSLRNIPVEPVSVPVGSSAHVSKGMRSILDGLEDACFLVTSELEVFFANEAAKALSVESSAPEGLKLFEVFPDHRLTEQAKETISGNTGVVDSYEVSVKHRVDGLQNRFWILDTAPVTLEDTDERHFRIIVRDETEQMETEQIRKDFVANASHELRTPLSIINGYLENMVDGTIDDKDMMMRSLVTMQKHGHRIARIVEDMLTISMFESVRGARALALQEKAFPCRDCVGDVLERLEPLILEKETKVVIDFPDETGQMRGDRFYWDQVFFNLIENALKQNQEKGLTLTITMKREADRVYLEVVDDGVGIPRASLPFVFKRFYRVVEDHSQEIKGTGLGLSIVNRAVEAHGGTIEVESVPGLRTAFKISVPTRDED